MPTHTAYQTVALHRRAKDGDRGDNAVTYAIVLAQTVLTEGTTGTMVYLDKTVGDNSPQRLVRTQMEAEGITIEGTNVEKYGTDYHRIYVPSGVVYGTNYTVIAYKTDGDNKTEIARATLGVTKKGDSTYLAQVTPASIELQTDADGYPIIESDMVITHDAALDDKDITKFMPCPNKTLFGYDVFMSCNKGKHLTASRMRIHFKGVSEIVFMYSSFAESTYDYLMLSKLNTSLPASCDRDNTAVQYHTSGNQTPDIANEGRYGNLNPNTEYFIDVMFCKDRNGDNDDDRGYIAIPVPTRKYTLRPSMQNATGTVLFDTTDSQRVMPTNNGLHYEWSSEERYADELNIFAAANRIVKQSEYILPVADREGEGGTQTVRVPVTVSANGATTSIYTLDIPAVIPVGTEDFGIVVVRTTGDETKRLTYEEAIADGIDVRGDYVEWNNSDQQFYLEGGAKEGTYRILLYRNNVKIQEYPVRCIKGDTGNSLNWILWSEVQNTNRTFNSKQSVGDTNIADIVIDDLSTDDNGIHTNRKYVCIKTFDYKATTDKLPKDYPDNFKELDYLGNVATDLLVSDAVSTKILNAVNARIDELIVKRLRTAANGCRIEMEGGAMKVFAGGNTNPNIVFGVVNGSAVLSYYNNNGQKLYDLGPEGIMQATHAFFAAYSDRTLRTAGVNQGYVSFGQNTTYYLWTQGEKTLEGGGVRNYTSSNQDTGWQAEPFTQSGKMFATKNQGTLPSSPLSGWYVDAWYGQDEIYGGITSSNVAVVNAYHYTNGAVDKSGQIFYQAGTVYFCNINGNRLSGITSIDDYMQRTGQS